MGPLVAASSTPPGRRTRAEFSRGPIGVGHVVEHVVGHDDVEGIVVERQVLDVAGKRISQLDVLEWRHDQAGRLDHPLGEVGQGEPDVGQERADVGPQVARPAPGLEHVGAFGPVHPRRQPLEPGLVGPRVLRVQCNPDVEVARVLVLRLAQVLLIGGESVARCGHDALSRRGMRPMSSWLPPLGPAVHVTRYFGIALFLHRLPNGCVAEATHEVRYRAPPTVLGLAARLLRRLPGRADCTVAEARKYRGR